MSAQPRATALVVGGFGALGTSIGDELSRLGWCVLRASRTPRLDDPSALVLDTDAVARLPELAAVVWAQGTNVNDSVYDHDKGELSRVFEVNVGMVAEQLATLLRSGRIVDGARLVVVSSIWEQVARPGKFSYTLSKAALGGLVRAAALDLAPRHILVNAVLPGVVDTPMTRGVLSDDQVAAFEKATGWGRLVRLADVASLVAYLASERNTGVTGQSIAVDLGFSVGRQL